MMSLTTRLTLLFTLVSVGGFVALGVLITASIERHFKEQDFSELEDKARLIAEVVENLQRTGGLASIDGVIRNSAVEHDSISIQIESPAGTPLFSTGTVAVPIEPSQLLQQPGEIERMQWTRAGTGYRGAALALPRTDSREHPLVIYATIETTRHRLFMEQFARGLGGLLLAAILLSALFGWLVARQGLAPLRLMRAQAKSVTARKLDRRLPVERVPAELAALAQELNRMLDRLENSFNRLTHFSSDIAHELRTPISNLMTQTQVSLSQARSAEEYHEILASNLEELEKLSRMIADMLFLAKADHGVELPSRERFPLERELAKLFDFYEVLAEERGVHLSLHGSGELYGDRLMVDRALGNLLSNALRHTPEGGAIQATIEPMTDRLQVRICNEGPTIPAEELPLLFDRFYRGDRSRSHGQVEGTGLGLSITRAIVRAHGGDISVSSQNRLSCFTLWFPQ